VEESASVMQESLAIARGISDDRWKSRALKAIAVERSKQGQVEESLAITRGISSERAKSNALCAIAVERSKQGQLEESLAIARGISHESEKSRALKDIAVELSKQGNFAMAQEVGLEIAQIAQRQEAWKEMAATKVETDGWQKTLLLAEEFQSDEAKLFYLKGWAECVAIKDVVVTCIQEALPMIASDSKSIDNLLQYYAVNLVMMGKPSRELTDRLNRTLNIQWALDIAAQFPKEESSTRLSTNLDTWLHEIEDEDDREQIELWAKQVAKGKIKEEEFGGKIRGIN
jgi:hypothetical protein